MVKSVLGFLVLSLMLSANAQAANENFRRGNCVAVMAIDEFDDTATAAFGCLNPKKENQFYEMDRFLVTSFRGQRLLEVDPGKRGFSAESEIEVVYRIDKNKSVSAT